ncbi:MAG: exodeoxyribonuclease VII small subunit [Oscillospiraceae bacterium]
MATKNELTFEQASKRIDEIISLLEKDNIDLEKSLDLFKEGTKLIALCDEKILNAKLEITKINDSSKQ